MEDVEEPFLQGAEWEPRRVPVFLLEPPAATVGNLTRRLEEREARMDFTYVWFLTVSLMLTQQHQGNPTPALSSWH